MDSLAEDILEFWFGPGAESEADAQARGRRWFAADAAFDEQIRNRFGALPDRAARGELARWESDPRSALALVLVLDQFPRNLYRESPRAFDLDRRAQAVALAAIDAGFDRQLSPLEAVFLYLPLEHSEDLALQDRCVALYEALAQRAPAGRRAQWDEFTEYARRHRAIIQRFGRFPHRNAVLGRVPTPDEVKYLESGGETFSARRSGG